MGNHPRIRGDQHPRLTAIRRLPVNYRVLIYGHYMKGLRYEELAEALDLPMGTVKTHLHRAKRQLRHLLETEFR